MPERMLERMPKLNARMNARENVRIDAREEVTIEWMSGIMPEKKVRMECQIECQNRLSEYTCHIYIYPGDMP